MTRLAGAAPAAVLWALPLLAGLAFAVGGSASGSAWQDLLNHPQLWPALGLSLWTATASTAGAVLAALFLSAGLYGTRLWHRFQVFSTASLAVPHLAFAIGLSFLIMPSGWLARVVVGGDTPPPWQTVQDSAGLALVAALVLKEIPFLLVMIWAILARGDAAATLSGQWRAARSLGHGPGSAWLRIIQPQLLQRLLWPIVIVWIYGATVVDVALVIGPTQPPTLAVILWSDLNDAAQAMNDRGLAGAAFLTLAIALTVTITLAAVRLAAMPMRQFLTGGPSRMAVPGRLSLLGFCAIAGVYGLAVLLLVPMSLAPRWPYPSLWPDQFQLASWSRALDNSSPFLLSLGLGAATAAAALAMAVLWFESQPPQHDRVVIGLALAALGVPQILIAAGQYRVFLSLDLTSSLAGLFLAHLTPVLAYVVIVLSGPYRGFDLRYSAVARSLGVRPWAAWWRIKAPLLRAPLLMAAAVGFSVSMVQFVPAQLAAAGRFTTLPMEAVTLTSGGNRSLTAAFALALTLPSLGAFIAASVFGRPRWH